MEYQKLLENIPSCVPNVVGLYKFGNLTASCCRNLSHQLGWNRYQQSGLGWVFMFLLYFRVGLGYGYGAGTHGIALLNMPPANCGQNTVSLTKNTNRKYSTLYKVTYSVPEMGCYNNLTQGTKPGKCLLVGKVDMFGLPVLGT